MGNAKRVVLWIKDYFFNNARPDTKAVIGISGGKDSSICAALCVEALGKERVLGVLMPQDKQKDIDDSIRLCEHLGIDYITINIGDAVYDLKKRVIENMAPSGRADMEINLPARIRMAVLYAVAQNLPEGGRVCNTCNYSEDFVGYSTKYGDAAGDFSPLGGLTVTEVRQLGLEIGLPEDLVLKTPSDGLCGQSDEDKLGFTYEQLDDYINEHWDKVPDDVCEKIKKLHMASRHKYKLIPTFWSYRLGE